MKRSEKEWKRALLAAALALAVLIAWIGPALADRPEEGEPAPNFLLKDIYGTTHSLSSYYGRIVVLAFFSDT